MANEVMNTLFGVTPESLQAQRDAEMQAQAYKVAQLDPFQQARYSSYLATNRLGSAVGGLLGAEDPELMRIRQRQSLLQGVDPNDPKSLREAALTARQQGDSAAALQLAQKASEVEQAQAKLATETARAKSLTSGIGKLNPQNYTAESWAKYSETGNLSDLVDKQPKGASSKGPIGNISPKDFTPESMQAFLNSVQTGAPDYSLLERVKPAEKELPASLVAKASDIDANISKLTGSVNKLGNLETRINNLDLGLIQNLARGGAAALGVNTKDRVEFDSLQRTARQEANNLLLLAKGAQTEGDAQRAQAQIADPNTWKNKDALKAAFKDLKDTHDATLEALKTSRATIATQGKTPSAQPSKGGYTPTQEAMISRWMAANKRSREEVISYLKSQGKL